MKKLMNLIMLSCHKATFLLEKSVDMPLSFMDRIQLSMHLKICDKCAEYQKQSSLINTLLRNKAKNFNNSKDLKLSEITKTRIQSTIDNNLKK